MSLLLISRLRFGACLLITALGIAHADTPPEIKEAARIFDFSDLDIPDAPAPSPPAAGDPLPAEVNTVLQKWDHFQQARLSARRARIVAMRQVAAEILMKRASAADPVTRASLVDEAKRLTGLPPETPVINPAPAVHSAPGNQGAGILGSWKKEDNDKDVRLYTEDRVMTSASDFKLPWVFVDEKNVVALLVWGPNPELIHVTGDRYESMDLLGKPSFYDRVKPTPQAGGGKTPPPAKPAVAGPPNSVVTKLAADEAALSVLLEKLFAEKRARITAYLRAQAAAAKGAALAAVMQRMVEFDNAVAAAPAAGVEPPREGVERIAGAWKWHGKSALLTADGKATVEDLGSGTWVPAKGTHGAFALVLHDSAGRTAKNQIMLGRVSGSDPATMHIADATGKKYDVTKKPGP